MDPQSGFVLCSGQACVAPFVFQVAISSPDMCIADVHVLSVRNINSRHVSPQLACMSRMAPRFRMGGPSYLEDVPHIIEPSCVDNLHSQSSELLVTDLLLAL